MNVQVEETGPVERSVRVEIATADVDAAFDQVYRRLQPSARLRGFRPGKAPRSVLEKYYGDQAQTEVLERLVRDSLPRAIEELELDVVSEPDLQPEGLPKQGAPFSYAVQVEIRPQIELAQVRGLNIEPPELPEPEQDPVEQHIEELRHAQATVVEEEPGVPAAKGHIVILNYEGRLEDGESFEGGSGQEVEIDLGAGQTLPAFEEHLLGLQTGQSSDFEVEIPEDDRREQVAGKRVRFHVDVLALKRRELAALDDEFAKDVSDFETLEEFRSDLRRRVEEGREAQRQKLQREALIDALVAANPFPVPPSLVERTVSSRILRTVRQIGRELPEDTLTKLVEQWRESWREPAERDVRLSFLVGEIGRAEAIEVSDEEYDAKLRQIAEQVGQPLTQVVREYREKGLSDAVRAELLERKVLEWVLSHTLQGDG